MDDILLKEGEDEEEQEEERQNENNLSHPASTNDIIVVDDNVCVCSASIRVFSISKEASSLILGAIK